MQSAHELILLGGVLALLALFAGLVLSRRVGAPVLLVFSLMVGPAATAQRLTARLGHGMLLAAGLALIEAWAGLTLAYDTDWPASFWITALSGGAYLVASVPRVGRAAV